MGSLPIRLERAAGVATLTLCQPARKNVLNAASIEALQAHADTLHEDASLRVVLLQAQGPIFSAGGDVKEMAEHLDDLPGHIARLIVMAHRAVLRLATLPVPVVGLLRGAAAGGGASLALACDLLVGARSARLVVGYPKLGTTPDCGMSHALIERLGPQRALQLFLLSDVVTMDEAHRLGLVHQVVDDDEVEAAARRIAERLAALPSGAAKALFLHGRSEELAARLEREQAAFVACSRTQAFRDGVLAFARRAGA